MNIPAQWTAALIGEMHLQRVTGKQLAAEVGWHPKYLSAVLNGRENPKGAEKKLKAALLRIEERKEDAWNVQGKRVSGTAGPEGYVAETVDGCNRDR